MNLLERYRGALVGLATGDALGTTLEFATPGTFEPVEDMCGGGPFALEPGQWTDDTSMALCLADTGNGSIMRLAPVPLFFASDKVVAIARAGDSSRTTHAVQDAVDACRYLAALILGALEGRSKTELLRPLFAPLAGQWNDAPLSPNITEVAGGTFLRREPPHVGPGADRRRVFRRGSDSRHWRSLALSTQDIATCGCVRPINRLAISLMPKHLGRAKLSATLELKKRGEDFTSSRIGASTEVTSTFLQSADF